MTDIAQTAQARLAESAHGYVDDTELRALERAGYGERIGFGARPALLVVDVTWGFCGDDPSAGVLEAVETYPHACGRSAWEALPQVRSLVDAARRREIPVYFTRSAPPERRPGHLTRWDDKNRRQRTDPARAFEIVPDSGFRPGDTVLEKECPSAFFGTPLLRWLIGHGADSVIVCGTTTSGCVRATVVDAFSNDLKVAVVLDATFDRVVASHRMSLFDMGLKYADVIAAREVVAHLDDLEGASVV